MVKYYKLRGTIMLLRVLQLQMTVILVLSLLVTNNRVIAEDNHITLVEVHKDRA